MYQCISGGKRCVGLTLLEVMLALAISATIITVLTKLYLDLHRSVLTTQQFIQQNFAAEKIMAQLVNDIASAGQIGCARLSDQFHIEPYADVTLTAENSLIVNEHKIVIRYQDFPAAELLMQHGSTKLLANADDFFAKDQLLIISDCAHAEIFKVYSVVRQIDRQVITTANALHHHYQAGAEIGRYVTRQYYLRFHGDQSDLMLEDFSGFKYVFQSGVNQLHFARDEAGIDFEFQTMANNDVRKWYGYAAKT